jgi:hypothetical protein
MTTCEIPACDQPATHVQLIENTQGYAIPAEVCQPHCDTERASDRAIARSRARLDQARQQWRTRP